MAYTVHEIEGKRFGHLTAIRFDHNGRGTKKSRYKSFWLCRCDCGKECFVERYNLISGKTRSCGHLRSDNIAMTRGQFRPVDIDEQGKSWILKHYKHTKNEDIKRRYDLTDGWLHRFARANGLKKSPQFMRKCQGGAASAAKESHVKNDSYPPKGYRIPGSEKAGFKPGHKESRWVKARRAKSNSITRTELIKSERVRIKYGYRQRTKLKVDGQTRRRYAQRSYLKSRGYVLLSPKEWVAYYDENTRRCPGIESRRPGDKGYVHWRFLPITEKTNNQ